MNPPVDQSPMIIGDDVSPNLAMSPLPAVDLFDPKAKATAKQRRAAMKERTRRYIRVNQGVSKVSPAEKYIIKLSTLAFRQLIRRLKQAARLAAHFKHEAAKCEKNYPGKNAGLKFHALQDNALMCFTHIQTEIEHRTKTLAE